MMENSIIGGFVGWYYWDKL